MSEKAKRKHSSLALPSLWSFPKPFRYEVKGNFQHVIQALESMALKQKGDYGNYDVQMFSEVFDGETPFSIYRSRRIQGIQSIDAEAHGHIRALQSDSVVVEGYALMGFGAWALWITMIICFLIVLVPILLVLLTRQREIYLFTIVLFFPSFWLFVSKVNRDTLLEDLLTALQTYTVPADEENLNGTSDLETPQSQSHP